MTEQWMPSILVQVFQDDKFSFNISLILSQGSRVREKERETKRVVIDESKKGGL